MKHGTRRLAVLGVGSLLLLVGCGGGSGSDNAADFCDLAEAADVTGDELDAAFDEGRPRALERALSDAIEAYESAAKAAPDDIKDDVDTMVDAQQGLAAVFEKNDYDLEASLGDPDFEDLIGDDSIQTASDRVDDYLEDECGIDRTSTDEAAGDTVPAGSTDDTTTGPVDTEPIVLGNPPETTVATGSVELEAEVGGTTVGTPDSPSAVYAALLTNPTGEPASNLEINFTMFDEAGTVVGTATGYLDLLLPGETRAVTGSSSITAPAARIEATYSGDVGMPFGTELSDLPEGQFGFEGNQLIADDFKTGTLGLLTSTYPVDFQNVQVDVVFRDATGSIIGGGFTYVGILANGQVGIEPAAYYQIPNVDTYELYASYSVYEVTD